jgi:hypothetical protein
MELENESSGINYNNHPKHSIGQVTFSNQHSRLKNLVKNNSQSQNQMSMINDDNSRKTLNFQSHPADWW